MPVGSGARPARLVCSKEYPLVFTWITGFIGDAGYLAIALLMFAENVFPPIPSELIMPLAGFTAARGELDIALVLVSGTAGSLAGAPFWYVLPLLFGCARLRRGSAPIEVESWCETV